MINAKIELALARIFFLFSSANAIISEFGQALEPWFLEIRERGEEIEEVGQRGRRNDCVGKPGGHLIHHRAKNKLRPEKDFPRGEKRSADREQTGVGPSRGSSKGWRIPFASSILEKGKMFALLRGRDVSTNALPSKFHSEQTVYRSFLSLSLSLLFLIPFESRSGWDSQSNFSRVPSPRFRDGDEPKSSVQRKFERGECETEEKMVVRRWK